MNSILFSFLFFLPAGVANMMPVIAAKLPLLSEYCYPLDFGKSLNGKRIFGDHKTIRGLVAGVWIGIIVALLLVRFYPELYQGKNVILVGFLLSFGALAGDSIKSFFKRRVGIASGQTWFPFDQIDYIVGGLLLSLLVVRLSIIDYVVIFILYFVLHLVSTTIGYFLNLKSSAI